MKFEIHKAQDGSAQPYWWRAVGNNNEILCHSERLSSRWDALNTINVIKNTSSSATVYNHTGEDM